MKPSIANGSDRLNPAEEALLRQCLEGAAPEVFRGESGIAAIHRARVELATSYDTHLITVRLANDREVRVFLKDFSSSLRPKNDPKQRREREVSVALRGAVHGRDRRDVEAIERLRDALHAGAVALGDVERRAREHAGPVGHRLHGSFLRDAAGME